MRRLALLAIASVILCAGPAEAGCFAKARARREARREARALAHAAAHVGGYYARTTYTETTTVYAEAPAVAPAHVYLFAPTACPAGQCPAY